MKAVTEMLSPEMSTAEFISLVEEWLRGDEGPKEANLEEALTEAEFRYLVTSIAEAFLKVHFMGRDLGRAEGRAEVERWRIALSNRWPIPAGVFRGN
jgi:hypothetical protein